MNNHVKQFFLLMFLSIILLIPCVTAYSTTNLVSYYSMESTPRMIDARNNYNLSNVSDGVAKSVAGIQGNGFKLDNTSLYNGLFRQLDQYSNFTINYWAKFDSYNSNRLFELKNSNKTVFDNTYSYYLLSGVGNHFVLIKQVNSTSVSGGSLPYSNDSQYHMYTLIFTNNSNMAYYVDGSYVATTTGVSLNIFNLTYLQVGFLGQNNRTIDEMSVWNYSFNNIQDLSILYNYGVGLSYAQTLANENGTNLQTITKCVSQYTYCANASLLSGNNYYCNVPFTYCSLGCFNDSSCLNYTANTCGIIGESKCYDSTSYNVCDVNANNQLTFDTLIACPIGTYCSDAFKKAICKNATATGVHDDFALSVTPYAISNANTTYTLDTTSRNLKVSTIFSLQDQKFFDSGTNFTARDCNYIESNAQSSISVNTITNSTLFTLATPLGSHQILRMSLLPSNFDNGSIDVKSQAGSTQSLIHFTRNLTSKSVCIYDTNNVLLTCDYDYTGTDTLKNVYLEYDFNYNSRLYTLKMLFNRSNPVMKIVYPVGLTGLDTASIRVNGTNTTLFYYNIANIPIPSTFAQQSNQVTQTVIDPNCDCGTLTCSEYKLIYGNTAYTQLCSIAKVYNSFTNDCLYSAKGSFKVRTYGNNNGIPDYSSYTDYTVTMVDYGLTQQQLNAKTEGNQFLNTAGLTNTAKYLIVLFTILAILVAFISIGFATKMLQASFIVGMLVSTFALIIFTVLGWISWVIIVMLLIVAIAISILLSKTNSVETG